MGKKTEASVSSLSLLVGAYGISKSGSTLDTDHRHAGSWRFKEVARPELEAKITADQVRSVLQRDRQEGQSFCFRNVVAAAPGFRLGVSTRPQLPTAAAPSRRAPIESRTLGTPGLFPCSRQGTPWAGAQANGPVFAFWLHWHQQWSTRP